MKKDIINTYLLYLQTLDNVERFGNTYGDENTLRILERELFDEPKENNKKNKVLEKERFKRWVEYI